MEPDDLHWTGLVLLFDLFVRFEIIPSEFTHDTQKQHQISVRYEQFMRTIPPYICPFASVAVKFQSAKSVIRGPLPEVHWGLQGIRSLGTQKWRNPVSLYVLQGKIKLKKDRVTWYCWRQAEISSSWVLVYQCSKDGCNNQPHLRNGWEGRQAGFGKHTVLLVGLIGYDRVLQCFTHEPRSTSKCITSCDYAWPELFFCMSSPEKLKRHEGFWRFLAIFDNFCHWKLNDNPPSFSQNAFHYGGISEVVYRIPQNAACFQALEVVKCAKH